MGTSFKAKLAQFSPERQARIKSEADRLEAEYLTLKKLRKAKSKTQVYMAQMLGITQAAIAQREKNTDVLLSTLRSYVEAMGGKLDLVVTFPNEPDSMPVHLMGLGDTEEVSETHVPA